MSSRWPRCATSPPFATSTAGRWPCPRWRASWSACLDAIRDARAQHPDLRQLEWNRVMLYLWPPIDLSIEEIRAIARRLAPLTAGFGLEQIVISGRFVIDGLGTDRVGVASRLRAGPRTDRARHAAARGADAAARRLRPQGHPDAATRPGVPVRARPVARPRAVARSSSTTSMDDRLVPVERRAGRQQGRRRRRRGQHPDRPLPGWA